MSTLKVFDDSKNYTCQVIKLPTMVPVPNLDRLVEVNHQGNSVLVGKDSDPDTLYLFFPSECQISDKFLSANNLYRHENLNADNTQKGFFEDNRRVKAIKFKGIISSGFIIPFSSLAGLIPDSAIRLSVGDEFNSIDGVEICKKYYKKVPGEKGFSNPRAKVLDDIIDSRLAPEHPDTAQLLKNTHKLELSDVVAITYKLHGTSARTYRTLVKRKLSWKERVAKFFGVEVESEEYNYVAASRRTLKSVGFEELPGKNHYFVSGDLWSEVAKKELEGKLNKGESIYYEIIGKTYTGENIQGNYTYGFNEPQIFVYRIANINPDGIEVDLSYTQMLERCITLGLKPCPELFYGKLSEFIATSGKNPNSLTIEQDLNDIFYNNLLEKPSILDSSVVEEGFCVRKDTYPKPEIFKIKSKIFLKQESDWIDKDAVNLEDQESQIKPEEDATATDSNS